MKHFKYIILLVMVVVFSCDDATSDPNNFYDANANGAWLKTLTLNANLNLNDIDSAQFLVTLQEEDEQGGDLLSSVKVYAAFTDNTVEDEDITVPETEFMAFSASDFDATDGFPQLTHIITVNEISDFLNLDPADLSATDVFVFRYELYLTDGRIYSTSNSGTNIKDITNPFYASPFQYTAPLVCPVEETYAVGTYDVVTTIPGAFGASFTGTIELTVGSSPTKRSFNGDWIGFGNIATWQFDLVCGNIIFDEAQGTGLACAGGPGIQLDPGETFTSYDENDDAVLYINFTENTLGDCGAGPTQNQIMLTKQ